MEGPLMPGVFNRIFKSLSQPDLEKIMALLDR